MYMAFTLNTRLWRWSVGEPRVIAQPVEQIYDEPGSGELVATLQTKPLKATASQPEVAAAAAKEVAPAQVAATGTSASGSGHVAKE